MKTSNLTFLIGVLASAFTLSCSRLGETEIDRSAQSLSAASIVASSAAPTDKAEKIAAIADTLFSSGAFQQALDVTDVALEFDSSNLRAGLISALARPLLNMKGAILRAAPLVLANSNSYNQKFRQKYLSLLGADLQSYNYRTYDSRNQPNVRNFSTLFTDAEFYNARSFYAGGDYQGEVGLVKRVTELDAKKPGYALKTEADLQVVLDSTIESFDHLREFTKAHKNSQITMTATALLIPDLIERYASACIVKENPTLVYELTCPPDETRTRVSLNRADFELIGDIAAYYQFMFTVAAGYDVPGLAKLSLEKDGEDVYSRKPDAKAAMEALVATPGFGKLRSTSKLQKLQSMSLDLIGGLNWALANQETLCRGNAKFQARQGFVFNEGFCLGAMGDILSQATKATSGQAIDLNVGGAHTAEFKPFAFLATPMPDLMTLKPVFNSFGAVVSVSDQTLGGAFPKSEADYVLKASAGEQEP